MESKTDRERERRLKAYRKKQSREEAKAIESPVPVGTPRPKLSKEERTKKFMETLDDKKLGDSFIISQIDDLFLGCTGCKSSVRHVMNRWDIDEDPETFMPKIDRVAQTIYKKQPAQKQMHLTVKDVAVKLIHHIESRRTLKPELITLEGSVHHGQETNRVTIES